jgi:hypothetical protein
MTATKKTQIVVGKFTDGWISDPYSVTGEAFLNANITVTEEEFAYSEGATVQLTHHYLADGSVDVYDDDTEPNHYVEDTDYSIDYNAGTLTILDEDLDGSQTHYYIDYHSCPPIQLKHQNIVSASEAVNTDLIKDTDYTIDYDAGILIAIYDGDLTAEEASIDYNWNDATSLVYKINVITSAATSVQYVCLNLFGQNGVATILYTITT